jgi:hypothetical protein
VLIPGEPLDGLQGATSCVPSTGKKNSWDQVMVVLRFVVCDNELSKLEMNDVVKHFALMSWSSLVRLVAGIRPS